MVKDQRVERKVATPTVLVDELQCIDETRDVEVLCARPGIETCVYAKVDGIRTGVDGSSKARRIACGSEDFSLLTHEELNLADARSSGTALLESWGRASAFQAD